MMNPILEGEVFQSLCKRAAGTMAEFCHGRQGALWMTSSMDATEGREQSDLKQDNSRNHGDVVKFLWAHATKKLRVLKMTE